MFEEVDNISSKLDWEQCGKRFTTEKALRNHEIGKHTVVKSRSGSETETELHCDPCNFTCKKTETLKKHINTKHPNANKSNPFKCRLCHWESTDENQI